MGYHFINARLMNTEPEDVAKMIAKVLGDLSTNEDGSEKAWLDLIWDGKRSAQKRKINYI